MTSQCQELFENDYADNRKDVACAQEYKERSKLGEQVSGFTNAEIKHRYQEGYDHYDKQYSKWVQKFHSENNPEEQYLDISNAEINLYEHRYQEGCELHHNE